MSYITTGFNSFVRFRLMLGHIISKRNLSHTILPNSLATEIRTFLPGIRVKPHHFNQLEKYSTAVSTHQKINDRRISKILLKLSANQVSLQFDELKTIRAKLFKNYNVTVDNGFNILKSCSQLLDRSADERIKLVNEAWDEIVSIVDTPTRDHLILLLQAYRRAGLKHFDEYQTFFEKFNCPIDADIYAELMYILCQNGDTMEKAEELLKEMADKNIQPSDRIYNALILGHSRHGDTKAMEKVLETMKSAKISPTLDTKTELIKGYILNGMHDKAMELLQQSSEYSTDQLCEIIQSAAKQENENIIKKALSLLPESIRSAKLIAPQIQNICIELVYLNQNRAPESRLDPYQLIIQHLPVPQFEIEDATEYGTFLLKEMMVTNESVANTLRFCENLIESNRNLYAIHSCCMYSLVFNLPSALDFLEALAAREPLRPHYFWPLFSHAKNQTQVIDIIKFAKKCNTIMDTMTLSDWILPRMNTLVNSQETVKALAEIGVRMLELKSAAIVFLLRKNRPKEALEIAMRSTSTVDPYVLKPVLVDYIKSATFKKNAYTTATLIKKLQNRCNDKTYDLAGQIAIAIINKQDYINGFSLTKFLIQQYERAEVKISPSSAQIILGKVMQIRSIHEELSPVVQNLVCREMFPQTFNEPTVARTESEIDTLKHQLAELQANGFPTHGVLHRIFLKYVQYEQYDEAIEIKKQCDTVGVLDTPSMLSSMLKLYTATKDELNALKVLKTLQKKHPKFRLDTYKIIDLATLLVSKDRVNDALKLIHNMGQCKDKNVTHFSVNVFNLLNAVAEYGVKHGAEENITAKFLEKLKEYGYCEYTNTLLGTVLKEFIDKKNIRDAFATFDHYAEHYRKTPQSLNFLTLLVQLSNGENESEYSVNKDETVEYMQRVIDRMKEIHGAENANVNVILAFALAGYDQQLRKILLNPTVKFNSDTLLKSLNYLKGRSRVDAVVALARCAHGIRHTSLSEEKLYEFLLNDFVRTNDYASAIQLYEEIQATDDAVMSKKFSKTLSELLAKNNQPLPDQLRLKSF